MRSTVRTDEAGFNFVVADEFMQTPRLEERIAATWGHGAGFPASGSGPVTCGLRPREEPRLYEEPGHWPPELLLQPLASVDQALERHASLKSRSMQHVKQVLGRNIPGGTRREWAAADSAHAGIKNLNARLGCCVGIRQSRVAGIVKMAAQLESRECRAYATDEIGDLRRNTGSNRVGECKLCRARGCCPSGDFNDPFWGYFSLEGTAEGSGERDVGRDARLTRGVRDVEPLL